MASISCSVILMISCLRECADGRGLEDGWAGEGEGCDGADTGAVRGLLAADGSLSV